MSTLQEKKKYFFSIRIISFLATTAVINLSSVTGSKVGRVGCFVEAVSIWERSLRDLYTKDCPKQCQWFMCIAQPCKCQKNHSILLKEKHAMHC